MRVTNRDPSQGPYLLLESAPPEDEDPLYTDSRAYDTSSLHRVLLGNRIPSASIVFQSHDQGIGKTQDDRGVEDVDEAVNSGMEENVDSSHEDLVQELWEDMRVVSRKVLRYASDSLDQSHTAAEDSTPLSEPTDAKSPDHATMNLNSAFTASSSRQGLDEEKPCESSTEDPAADPFKPPGEVRDPEANASQTKGSSSQSEGLEELQSDFASTSGLQMGPDKAGVPGATHDLIDLESPAMYMVSPRLSPRSFPINGPEIQMGGPLPPLPPPGTAAGVIITRPNNKPYEIPFRIARDSNVSY
ncbi:hypothetical protein BDV96DRAFT_407059 [Lophiotrema nucula]|uniref:Uncharacterized protein n=1 Tax=Lophiotrema nucula TaxID=690887 RepID=A0A6A5ZES7_9PLEO|nr:hypothetical protein BDV96DRAFT_407059 [Lophiotrema nucula]